jgi:hypothetical protein
MTPGKGKTPSPKKSLSVQLPWQGGSSWLCDTKVDHSLFTKDSALKDDSVASALYDILV